VNVSFRLLGYEVGRIEITIDPLIEVLAGPDGEGQKVGHRVVKRFSRGWTRAMTS
jgi:hypothetical protein